MRKRKLSIKELRVDPIWNFPYKHHKNCKTVSKEIYSLDLGSDRIKVTVRFPDEGWFWEKTYHFKVNAWLDFKSSADENWIS